MTEAEERKMQDIVTDFVRVINHLQCYCLPKVVQNADKTIMQ